METISNSFLVKEPVGKLMRKYAVPCIISWEPCIISSTRYLLPMRLISDPTGMRQIR